MVGGGVHTVPDGERWVNEIDGRRVDAGFDRKVDAVAAGRAVALRSGLEHHVHDADGTLAVRYSYGRDPRTFPG